MKQKRYAWLIMLILACLATSSCTHKRDKLMCKFASDSYCPPEATDYKAGDTLYIVSLYDLKSEGTRKVSVVNKRTDKKYKSQTDTKFVMLDGTPAHDYLDAYNYQGACAQTIGYGTEIAHKIIDRYPEKWKKMRGDHYTLNFDGMFRTTIFIAILSLIASIIVRIKDLPSILKLPVSVVTLAAIGAYLLILSVSGHLFFTGRYIVECPKEWEFWRVMLYWLLIVFTASSVTSALMTILSQSGSTTASGGISFGIIWLVTYWFFGELYTDEFIAVIYVIAAITLILDVWANRHNPLMIPIALAASLYCWFLFVYYLFLLLIKFVMQFLFKWVIGMITGLVGNLLNFEPTISTGTYNGHEYTLKHDPLFGDRLIRDGLYEVPTTSVPSHIFTKSIFE